MATKMSVSNSFDYGRARGEPKRRILLVSMPLADPLLPNLAIEQLAQIARSGGIECDVFYGTLNLGPRVPLGFIHSMMGPAIFAPAYHDVDELDLLEEIAEEIASVEETNRGRSIDVDDLVLRLLDYEAEARLCIERCVAAIKPGLYDIVGFSIGFDSQKLASALLAKHLKRLDAPPLVVFGGTGCDGPMAGAVLEAFPEVDCVVNGEATETFCQLIEWLRDPRQTHRPLGVAMRNDQPGSSFSDLPPAAPIEHVPDPDYTAFIEQRKNSFYSHQGLTLFFETSRGCWWGRKHHCTFCGIKTVRDPWRTTDGREALRRIEAMYADYAPDLLYCVDAILDFKHMKALLPELAERRRTRGAGPVLFYELKSNLKRRDVALLAQAGVIRAQPGIENFSNHVLRQMRKGVRGLDQVAVLKWCAAYGIDLIYGYLSGVPEETPADVWQAVNIIPHLHHLQPPVGVNMMGLHRFSPYEADPDRYGLKHIRPFTLQRLLFRKPDSVLMRLCYELDYSAPWQDDIEHLAAHAALRHAISDWHEAHEKGSRLVAREDGTGGIIVVRREGGAAPTIHRLSGAKARLFRAMDERISIAAAAGSADVPEAEARTLINEMVRAGLACHMEEDVLALPIPEIEPSPAARDMGPTSTEDCHA